jgi:hypothetical protein
MTTAGRGGHDAEIISLDLVSQTTGREVHKDRDARSVPENLPLWRQRDILAGRMSSMPFDVGLCEQLGLVLLRMGDDPAGGRFLFLCGRADAYQAPIELFLSRHRHGGWRALAFALPQAAKRVPFSSLPVSVQDTFRAWGYPPVHEGSSSLQYVLAGRWPTIGPASEELQPLTFRGTESPWQPIATLVFLLLLVSVIVGFYHMVGWILQD